MVEESTVVDARLELEVGADVGHADEGPYWTMR